jgi:hypothetical protein
MIPTVEDVKSSPLVHRWGDMFNQPGLTNFLGCVQVDADVTGIRSLNFPPFATSDTITNSLFVDGRFFKSTGRPVTFTWYPDRITREAEYDGLHFFSTTVLAVKKMAAVVVTEIENRSGQPREVELRLGFAGGITKSTAPWNTAVPPTEESRPVVIDRQRSRFVFTSPTSEATSCQGVVPAPEVMTPRGATMKMRLAPGEKKAMSFVNAIGETPDDAGALFDSLIGRTAAEVLAARDDWNRELAAVFTPGNDRYSGFLPELETTDSDIMRIYHTGILGVISFKRDTPYSVIGRAYDTLMPKWWQTVTFLWDYSLSSLHHALLDPDVMKKYLELWMHLDIHKHFGTEYLTGSGVGPWYSVNDFAMSVLARDYLNWTGNTGWLDHEVAAGSENVTRPVLDYLMDYARNWKQFRQPGGLADYGGLLNLLECVSTYVHQVASLNASNVFNMRFAADLLEYRGKADAAQGFRGEAAALVKDILPLYKEGEGYWRARFPDGSLMDVHHCYDFFTVLNTICEDLPPGHRKEMVEFFKREFFAETWMHALSRSDFDAMFSPRPDHQWNGAYPAWPPQALLALYRVGEADLALSWMHGLAKSANQGPFGQAHFVDTIIEPDAGGARKAPIDFPYITDWTVSSGGSWVSAIIEGLFGVRATLDKGVSAIPQFSSFDPKAELKNLRHQGKLYHVGRNGIRPAK